MGNPAMGVASQAAIDTTSGFSSASNRFSFTECSVTLVQEVLDASVAGIRGSRSRQAEMTRLGKRHVGGTVTMNPSPNVLNMWLQYIMGGTPQVGTPAGKTTFPLTDQLPTFYMEVDKVTKVPYYTTGVVTRAVFRGAEGELLSMTLDLQFTDEVPQNSGSFVAAALPVDGPLVFMDASQFTFNSTGYQCKSFELTIDNISNTERFLFSTTRAVIPQIDRAVSLRVTTPYTTSEAALYPVTIPGNTADLTFTNGSQSFDLNFPGNLMFTPHGPVIGSKDEILLQLDGIARRTLAVGHSPSTDELVAILKLS